MLWALPSSAWICSQPGISILPAGFLSSRFVISFGSIALSFHSLLAERFTQDFSDTREFSLQQMGSVFGIARSGYYKWLRQGNATQRCAVDVALTEQIRVVFEHSSGTYGSPRNYAELKSQGVCGSRRRIARLMRAAQLDATPALRRTHTTQS